MTDVAALYIDPMGIYPKLLGPELCWDEKRDARLYDGPHPVVAHPPCGPWGRLRHLYRGQEHDLAPLAVHQVRRFGGVLEHPADSLLWKKFRETYWGPGTRLPYADEPADNWGGFTVEIDQVEWGHVARKRTWLYIVGVPGEMVDLLVARRPSPGREPTHCVAWRSKAAIKAGKRECSAELRRRTPAAFAEFLIALARQAQQRRAEVA